MNRYAMLLSLVVLSSLPAQKVRLDSTRAFYAPQWTGEPTQVLAETNAGAIHADAYLRYLGTRLGERHLEELAFDFVLARECEARGVLRSAPILARSMTARRLQASGRSAKHDPSGSLRARFATEALRQLRVDALVGAAREVDEAALRSLFDHRYGVDGVRVRLRQILIASDSPRQQDPRDRARELRERLRQGESFETLLRESDDRTTRRLLRDPERAAEAGIIEGYNYRRYGDQFAATVRSLDVGETCDPVESSVGYHLIQVLHRKVTKFENVGGALRKELGGGKAKKSEVDALRRRLLEKYGFEVKR